VGEDWVLKGLDEEITKMDTGERKTVELIPEKAWGDRDPTLLRMIPMRKFGEKADEMRVGDVVEVDNRLGVVRFIGSGRAQVDFNHRLAGKTLVYDVEVVSKVDTDEQKIRSLIKRRFPGEIGDKIEFTHHAGDVTVDIPEEAFMAEGLQVIKRGVSNDVVHFLPAVKKVTFKEVYARKDTGKAAEKKEAEPAEGTKEEAAAQKKEAKEEAKAEAKEEAKEEAAAQKKEEAAAQKKEAKEEAAASKKEEAERKA
jgi:peptidylprolyl isomerase